MLFAKSDGCAFELFDIALEEILSRDFLLTDRAALSLFLWSSAKKELNADTLTEWNKRFSGGEQLTWKTSKTKKGGKQLFDIMDNETFLKNCKLISQCCTISNCLVLFLEPEMRQMLKYWILLWWSF